ncbi:hypothetical protein EB796_023624 [Bugula neritina]|uniref:Uncharacterized protein n=1 Tax=Bugula neritina TaxID=10212 RepID=A0A7J7IVX6_BUGNE|nr:hypothetical protein EB796_023624 [Bugula neritina]
MYDFVLMCGVTLIVDGEKFFHGYIADSTVSKDQQCPSGCPCGTNEGPNNDIRALCSAMLKTNGVNETLIAAYVVKPHCNNKGIPSKRVKFYLGDKNVPVWDDVFAPNGYIRTLQCLTEQPNT